MVQTQVWLEEAVQAIFAFAHQLFAPGMLLQWSPAHFLC